MLNIPETVKALFKADGIRKNFRVHFPNGELADLTNDNIVQESARFTESLCSQDVLKFGLTEASVLEFETVGVANMYGMTIECGIEIDLSSLSAAQLSEIEAGTWDGVYVSVANSDIGYAYFRVPYGVFRVESCPRDHQAMTHRRVQTFGYSPSNLRNNPYETRKQNTPNVYSTYKPNMFSLMMELVGYNIPGIMSANGYTATDLTSTIYTPASSMFQANRNQEIIVKDADGNAFNLLCAVYWKNSYSTGSGNASTPYKIDMTGLYSADLHGIDYDDILLEIVSALMNSSIGIDLEQSGYGSWRELARACLTIEGIYYLYPGLMYYPKFASAGGKNFEYQKTDIRENNPVIYPYVNDLTWQGTAPSGSLSGQIEEIYGTFCALTNITIANTTSYEDIYTKTIPADKQASFQIYQRSEPIPELAIEFAPTESGKNELHQIEVYWNSFGGVSSARALVEGYLELSASFGKVTRSGMFETVQISDTNPIPVPPSEFSNFWWDEYDVLPIGTVNYTFANQASEEEESVESYEFGSGESIYDMSDNEVLKNLAEADATSVEALLDELFIPNLGPVAFTPIDLEMKGLPYIEAGDYLAVTAEDGTIAYSYAMRQEISGVQVLTAAIESTSGEIINSEGSDD